MQKKDSFLLLGLLLELVAVLLARQKMRRTVRPRRRRRAVAAVPRGGRRPQRHQLRALQVGGQPLGPRPVLRPRAQEVLHPRRQVRLHGPPVGRGRRVERRREHPRLRPRGHQVVQVLRHLLELGRLPLGRLVRLAHLLLHKGLVQPGPQGLSFAHNVRDILFPCTEVMPVPAAVEPPECTLDDAGMVMEDGNLLCNLGGVLASAGLLPPKVSTEHSGNHHLPRLHGRELRSNLLPSEKPLDPNNRLQFGEGIFFGIPFQCFKFLYYFASRAP
mmetsp:Transcript_49811/g.85658  ORF Transcript_49811/g.85658 Transcript_49811/m.85658 type:complete len:273 (-) Transcript_49811:146-964(-)